MKPAPVSLSVLLIPVFMLRLYVSFGRGSPAVIDVKNLTPWLVFIHTMMYLIVVTVLISGVLMMDKPISFNVAVFLNR